jgi:hypothetical protein
MEHRNVLPLAARHVRSCDEVLQSFSPELVTELVTLLPIPATHCCLDSEPLWLPGWGRAKNWICCGAVYTNYPPSPRRMLLYDQIQETDSTHVHLRFSGRLLVSFICALGCTQIRFTAVCNQPSRFPLQHLHYDGKTRPGQHSHRP